MTSARSKLRKTVTLALACLAVTVLGLFLCRNWPILNARWQAWRVARAASYGEAQKILDAFQPAAQNSKAAEAFVSTLGEAQAQETGRFFVWLACTADVADPLAQMLRQRLDRDPGFQELWGGFVQWIAEPSITDWLVQRPVPRQADDNLVGGRRTSACEELFRLGLKRGLRGPAIDDPIPNWNADDVEWIRKPRPYFLLNDIVAPPLGDFGEP